MSERFELRVDAFWRPLIVPFGGTDARSYAEITDDWVNYPWDPTRARPPVGVAAGYPDSSQ